MSGTIRDAVAKHDGNAAPANMAPPTDGGGAVLALTEDQQWWSPRQIAALKAMGIKNASNEELLVFLHYCAKTRLDPFSKQIYMLERRNKNKDTGQWEYTQTIQTGIDGYRVVAQRAAKREGVHIEYEDTVWYDDKEGKHEVWLSVDQPAAARVTVVKILPDGTRLRYPGMARFSSYAAYGRNNKTGETWLQGQWGVMGDHMIEKCAEAFALRRAFPNDLGGVYAEEEMQERHEAPPKLTARQRATESDDEWVVPGTVADEPAGPEDGAPQDGGGTEPETGDIPEVDPKVAADRIGAIFKEHKLSAREHASTRRAVMTGLLGDGAKPTQLVTMTELAPQVVHLAAAALDQFVKEAEAANEGVTQKLLDYGNSIHAQMDPA